MTSTTRSEVHMDDPLNGVVQAMLEALNAGFPRVEQMTGPQARAAVAQRRVPVNNLDDVRGATDRVVPGPDGAVPVRIYEPHGEPSTGRAAIVFYHGGGFVFCDIESHDGFCRALARGAQAVVISADYRLAPEHPAPAAALDAFAVFAWTVEHAAELGIDPARTAVAGDSAGGNLAAVTAILCRDRGVTPPAAQLLIYPALDPTCDTDSYRRYATGHFNTRAAMRWYWSQYLGTRTGFDPPYLVAPARADTHAGLPPAVIVTAGRDPLHSEGCDYARRLRGAGVPVVHRDFPGLFHGFMTIQAFPPAASAQQLVCADLRELLHAADRGAVS
ncbi:alpha/beta hydrolase [Mycobacterium sp. M23085]|uniref:alpha/beta hydrolase n=1 Tax=Mycobacterium sp. M23085 TaxID=3378087 RepID=UPI003877B6EE